MRRTRLIAGLAAALLAACSPTFNWREARLEDTPLVAMLPCKPDRATRTVPLGATPVAMSMMGCEAGGVQFAVAVVPLADAARAGELLGQWRAATLANFSVVAPALQPFAPKGAPGAADGQMLAATGRAQDGQAVALQAAWFRHGPRLYQALAYGPALGGEVAETFLTGLTLQ